MKTGLVYVYVSGGGHQDGRAPVSSLLHGQYMGRRREHRVGSDVAVVVTGNQNLKEKDEGWSEQWERNHRGTAWLGLAM